MDNQDRPGYSREEHFYGSQPYGSGKLPGSKPPPFWRRHLLIIITSISVVLMLIFALITFSLLTQRGSGLAVPSPQVLATTTPTPAPTSGTTGVINSTPTSRSAPTGLPCVVDVSKWANGSADWEVLNNMLLNNGTNGNWDVYKSDPTIIAPCQLGNTANYAVETQIQVVNSVNNACFGITVRGSSVGRYMAGLGDCYDPLDTAYLTGSGYSNDSQGSHTSFNPSASMHTYRVEVNGNMIKFLIDGGSILSITDNRYLTGTQVGLWSKNVQLQVTSFQVTALS